MPNKRRLTKRIKLMLLARSVQLLNEAAATNRVQHHYKYGAAPVKKNIKSITELPGNNLWVLMLVILQAQQERNWEEKIAAFTLYIAVKLAARLGTSVALSEVMSVFKHKDTKKRPHIKLNEVYRQFKGSRDRRAIEDYHIGVTGCTSFNIWGKCALTKPQFTYIGTKTSGTSRAVTL